MMGIRIERSNFRVEVFPRGAGDFGWASISGVQRSEAQTEALCEEIAQDIRRHVDGLPSRGGVNVIWDTEKYCEHCGSAWTEKSKTYNGGCCDADEESSPDCAETP